jgi:threonine/homoserine/homoserine lactone efflux protein
VIPGFLAVTIPLVLAPGASTAVVLRNSLAGGTRAGVETAVGINSASFCWGLVTAFGLGLALRRWPSAWAVLQVGGAAYLAWLAAQSLRRAATMPQVRDVPAGVAAEGFFRNAYQGFFTNALNPSIATFYLVILPQFIPSGASVPRTALLLTTIHIAVAATWHVAWAAAGGTLAHVLARRRARQVLEVVAGAVLAGLAITIAWR